MSEDARAPRGRVEALATSPAAGAPMGERASLDVVPVVGILGDRYASTEDKGTFHGHPDIEVTLVEAEDAEAAGVAPLALRRNIITRGASLDALIGRTFRLGDEVILHGMRRCLPCHHIEELTGSPGLKARIRGGLRARVVRGGAVRVGDALEPVETTLDDDMRAVVAAARLAFVATVTPEGRPNLSLKGTIRVLDERRLFFLELASPQTRRDLAQNPWMEVNVVDATSRRGYRFYGKAAIHEGDDVHRAAQAIVFRDDGAEYENRGAVVLTVERALPLVSPGYDVDGMDEGKMRAAWKEKRAKLDAAFEAHVAARGPYRLR